MNPSFDETQWDAAHEGQLVRLLHDLAASREGPRAEDLAEQLRNTTGQRHPCDLARWLRWYLEDHLGIRPALGILAGREIPPVEGESGPALLENDVFLHAEYNWCAIERIRNRDDMVKLRQVYMDLESPIAVEGNSPLGFARLTGLSGSELDYYRGKTLTEALFDPAVRTDHLRTLKDYGKMMMIPILPAATQRSGAILYAASIARALAHFDTKISSLTYQTLAESIRSLLERPYIVETYATLFRAALDKCA